MAHMAFSHQSILVEEMEISIFFFDEKCGKKIREIPFGIKRSYVICSLFHRKERDELMYFFLLDLDPSGLTGLEPAASALTGRCSDQLNYNPREIKCTTYVVDLISFKPFYVDF